MNYSKQIMLTGLTLVTFLALDWLFHFQLLGSSYDTLSYLWRDMNEMYWLNWANYVVESYLYVCLFSMFKSDKLTSLGIGVGLIVGLGMASCYIYMPVTAYMAFIWFLAGLTRSVAVAVILNTFSE